MQLQMKDKTAHDRPGEGAKRKAHNGNPCRASILKGPPAVCRKPGVESAESYTVKEAYAGISALLMRISLMTLMNVNALGPLRRRDV